MNSRLFLLAAGAALCLSTAHSSAKPPIKPGVLSISDHAMRAGPCPVAQFTAFIQIPAIIAFPDSNRYVRITAGDIKGDPEAAWDKLDDDEGGGGVSSLNPYHVNMRKLDKTYNAVTRVVIFFQNPKRWKFYTDQDPGAGSDPFDGIAYSDLDDDSMFCEDKQPLTNDTYRTFTFKDTHLAGDKHGGFNIGVQLRKRFGARTPIILDPKAKNDGTDG